MTGAEQPQTRVTEQHGNAHVKIAGVKHLRYYLCCDNCREVHRACPTEAVALRELAHHVQAKRCDR